MHTDFDCVSKYFKTNFSNSFSKRINFELSVYNWLKNIFQNSDMSSVRWGIIFQTVLGWVRNFKMRSLLLFFWIWAGCRQWRCWSGSQCLYQYELYLGPSPSAAPQPHGHHRALVRTNWVNYIHLLLQFPVLAATDGVKCMWGVFVKYEFMVIFRRTATTLITLWIDVNH